jgi:hypothetical protein
VKDELNNFGEAKKMSELPQLASAMLTVAFAAVMLVAGQLYIEHGSTKMGRIIPAALTAPAL